MPYLVNGSRTDVVILTSRTFSGVSADERLARMLPGCARALPLISDDSAAVVAYRGPDGWPSVPPGAVGLVLLPQDGLAARCEDEATQHRIAAARGIRFTFDTTFKQDRDVRRVTIRHGSRELTPIATHQGTVRNVTPWGPVNVGAGMQRIDLALDAMMSDSTGLRAGLLLEIRGARDGAPDRVLIPAVVLDSVWADHISARAEAGGVAAALAQRLGPSAGRLSDAERRSDDVSAAVQLAKSGDSAAARYLLDRAFQRDPCLTFAPATDERARGIATTLNRPVARCDAVPLGRVALRAALMPGFGRPVESTGRRVVNGVLIATIVGTGTFGVVEHFGSKDSYDAYRAVEYRVSDPDTAAARARYHYNAAESSRSTSVTMAIVASGLWAASIVEGVWRERRYARYLAEIRDYDPGDPPRVGAVPIISPDRIGLSFTLPPRRGGAR